MLALQSGLTQMYVLQIYTLASLVLIFFYGLYSKTHALNSIPLSIFLSAIPTFFLGYIGPDASRIFGVPMGYMFTYAAFSSIIIQAQFKFSKYYSNIVFVFFVLILYLIIQSLIVSIYLLSSFQYIIMWIFYGLSMLSISKLVSNLGNKQLTQFFKYLSYVFLFCLCIGIFNIIFGYTAGSMSFFGLINRNATVFYIVIMTGIVTFMWIGNMLPKWLYIIQLFLIIMNIIMIRSRTGILGIAVFFLLLMLYNWRKKYIYIILVSLVLPIYGGLYISSTKHNIDVVDRFKINYAAYVDALFSNNDEVDKIFNLKDSIRLNIILTNYRMLQDKFFVGTGVGLKNYVSNILNYTDYDSGYSTKAHNFYISYLLEFGIFGYLMLLLYFYLIYSKINNCVNYDNNSVCVGCKALFISIAFMLLFNEYVTFPFFWVFIGVSLGYSHRIIKSTEQHSVIYQNQVRHTANA